MCQKPEGPCHRSHDFSCWIDWRKRSSDPLCLSLPKKGSKERSGEKNGRQTSSGAQSAGLSRSYPPLWDDPCSVWEGLSVPPTSSTLPAVPKPPPSASQGASATLTSPMGWSWGGSGGMQRTARSLKKRGSNLSWGESDTLTLCLAACGKGAPQNPMWGHWGGSTRVPVPVSRCASPGVGGGGRELSFIRGAFPRF